jgi:thymidylate synthase
VRKPKKLPQLKLLLDAGEASCLDDFKMENFAIYGYHPDEAIKALLL